MMSTTTAPVRPLRPAHPGRRGSLRTLWAALRAMLVATVILGVGYPILITAIGQSVFPVQANGSLLTNSRGVAIGSALLGQSFSDAEGDPLPRYFQPRPSAAGEGYDGNASGGSNLGPNNSALVKQIDKTRAALAAFNGVAPSQIPPDALTSSGSGLDPDISVAYALVQVDRVAHARGLSSSAVHDLVEADVIPRDLGILGEPRVNVLTLNLDLNALKR
jgi:K+-transporting ATPase ATPase C chain